MIVKLFINEAKQVGLLYHVCSIKSMAFNASKDSIFGGKWYGNSLSTDSVISFTRDKNYIVCTHADNEDPVIQLVLDGNKISELKKIVPYNDWYYRGKLDALPDVKYVSDLSEIGLPDDFDIVDVFYNPEKYGLPEGCYDGLEDNHEYEYGIDHFKGVWLRKRVLYDYCKANNIKFPYNEEPEEQRPVTDRQSEEMVIGDLKNLHEYIKIAYFCVGDKFLCNYVDEDESELLENIRTCVSYFKKYSIATQFKKFDYTYANSNHFGKTEFNSCYKLTDLNSLYSLVSRVSKKVGFVNKVKLLLENKDEFNLSTIPYWRKILFTSDEIISDKLISDVFLEYRRKVDEVCKRIQQILSGVNIYIVKTKRSNIFDVNSIKQCDENYLKRYVFNCSKKGIPAVGKEDRKYTDKDRMDILKFFYGIEKEINVVGKHYLGWYGGKSNDGVVGYNGDNVLFPLFSVNNNIILV